MQRRQKQTKWQHGFSLVELLAALAIASVIIVATGALVHTVARSFDKGTRSVSEGERLILAIERLAADIASTRFVQRRAEAGAAALAFIGKSDKIAFVGAGGVARNDEEEEVVNLAVEREGDVTRLVRRRAPWFGPRTRFEDLSLSDPVILFEGKFLISFAFGRLIENSALSWSDDWEAQIILPRVVRLILRDRLTGADLLGGTDFVIRADASVSCLQSASPACFASAERKK